MSSDVQGGRPLGRFRVADSHVIHNTGYASGTGWFNYEIGANRDGTQYAVPTYGGTFIYNAGLVKTGTVLGQYAGPQPVGVAYHPVEDVVYFPWTTTSEVRAFDTNTFAQTAAYDFEDTFTGNGNFAYRQGRLKMSRDGSLLFCTVTGGVRFVRLYAPLAASDQTVATDEDAPLALTLSGGVGNGGAVSYRVLTQPAHGTLSGSGASLTYTPEPNYNGADGFTFVSLYGTAESAPATVNVNVNPLNDAPTVEGQSASVEEDGAMSVTLSASDVDGDALAYTVVSYPAHGSLTGTMPNLVYRPAPNYSGTDGFSFVVFDGYAQSAMANVLLSVAPVNDAPVAGGDTASVLKNSSASITVLSNDRDVDGDALTVVAVSQPSSGTVVIAPGGKSVTYTARRNYLGNDSFSYVVGDGRGGTASAAVLVTVHK